MLWRTLTVRITAASHGSFRYRLLEHAAFVYGLLGLFGLFSCSKHNASGSKCSCSDSHIYCQAIRAFFCFVSRENHIRLVSVGIYDVYTHFWA